eukprot:SAG31_NODE_1658_length_7616_cov_2.929227_1_plen_349_part_00
MWTKPSILVVLLLAGAATARKRAKGAQRYSAWNVDPMEDLDGDGWRDDGGWLTEAQQMSVAAGDVSLETTVKDPMRLRCDFERIDASHLTAEKFVQQHMLGATPLLVEGLTKEWAATDAWAAPRLLKTYGDHVVLHGERPPKLNLGSRAPDRPRVSWHAEQPMWVSQYGAVSGVAATEAAADHGHSTLGAWLDKHWRKCDAGGSKCDKPSVSSSRLVFDRTSTSLARRLLQAGDFSLPEVFDSAAATELLLSLGPARSGLPMHAHGDTWLSITHGSKLWLVFPPGKIPQRSANLSIDSLEQLALQDAASTISGAASRGELSQLLSLPELMFCVQRAGETIYLPPMCVF